MKGVIAAVPTPVDVSGTPQKAEFLEHCEWLLENGCDGLNVLGSTGEANSLDSLSRKDVMRWASKALPVARLMVGTGTPSLAETAALTLYADALGYKAVLVLPPYFYKPATEQGLFEWYAALHDRLAGHDIAVYFYNFPQMTGIKLPVSLIARLCTRWPDRFQGIKDSSGDLAYCGELAKTVPGLKIFPSSEVALAKADALGFAGCISATTNQTGSLSARLWREQQSADPALIARIQTLRDQISRQQLVPSVKFLVSLRTGDVGWETSLPPFTGLKETRKSELTDLARSIAIY